MFNIPDKYATNFKLSQDLLNPLLPIFDYPLKKQGKESAVHPLNRLRALRSYWCPLGTYLKECQSAKKASRRLFIHNSLSRR